MAETHKFYRSRDDQMIAGVCGGIAEYFDIDPVFVRLIALVLLFVGNGATFIAYIVMAIVVPEAPVEPPTEAHRATAAPPADVAAEHGTSSVARTAGLTGGLVLIGVGVAFLAVRFLPDIAWWNMWPLLIILVGVSQCVTPGKEGWEAERFFGGLGTIAAGIVLLGNVTGYISWRVWWVLLSLWPVLLISIGLSIMGKGLRQMWLRALGSLVILVGFAYAVSVTWVGAGSLPVTGAWNVGGAGEPYAITEPAAAVGSAKLILEGGAGEILMDAGPNLIAVSGTMPMGEPDVSTEVSGDSAQVRIATVGGGPVIVVPGVAGPRMEVAVGVTPVWDIEMTTGASSLTADLSEVQLSGLTLSTGVSSSSVKLGPVPATEQVVSVLVKAGVASVEILVPEGAEARVTVAGGLTGANVGGRFEKTGDRWETPGFSSASRSYDIRIESGIGSVSVTTY